MMLPSGMVRDLTQQHIQGKSASQCSSIPKTLDKLFRGRMISNMPWEEPLAKFWVTWENHSRNKMPSLFLKQSKPKSLSMIAVRRFESKLFYFSITHDTLVDTWKFTG
jgi:hypothetical protein